MGIMSESFVAGEKAGGEGAAGAPLPYLPPPEAKPYLCTSLHCLLQWSRRPCTHHPSKRYACEEPPSSHSPCKAEGSSFPFRRKYFFCLLSLPWRLPFINLICQLCLRVAKGERAASIENTLYTHACMHTLQMLSKDV